MPTDVLLLVVVTTTAPPEAAVLSVTVLVELLPPLTLVGFKVSEERVTLEAGVMVREAFAELDPSVAVITAVLVVVTDVVVTVNEALMLPAATVTLLDTLADPQLLDSETTDPPERAALERAPCP